jgi:hypothetical protein
MYNHLEVKLKLPKGYIETNPGNAFIPQALSYVAALMIIPTMKDGGLRLGVDYRALNRATLKNQYFLPLISELLDRLCRAQIFTKLDLWNSYLLILFKNGDEYNTVLCI